MKRLITLLVFQFFILQSFSQITNTDVIGNLDVETIDNVSKIIAKSSNTTDVYYSLKYVFSVINYDSNNNTSKESIEELFTLDPNQTKDLYQTSISIEDDNKIILLLLIYDEDDKLIAKDRIVFNEDEEQKNTLKDEPKDGIVLLGIVADETKTKFGKDFYDFFYFYYTYNKVNGDKVVKIDEMRSFRRNTKITISIEEEVVFEFFTRPDIEFLEEMSKTAIRQVFKHFQKLKKEKSYITQY